MINQRARICIVSTEETFLRSRAMMLGTYFSVQPAGRFSEGVHLIRKNPYDLLILCYTLDDHQQETLASIARDTYAPVEVLVLQTESSPDKPYADHLYAVTRGPWRLIAKCAEIVGYRIKRRVHHAAVAAS